MTDLSFLQKFTKGNTAKMKKYISMYLKIAPETFSRMHQNVQDRNWADLAINAHSLKPQAEYMGLSQLKGLLIQIEQHAKKGQVKRLPNLFQQSLQAHEKGVKALKMALQQL